MNTLGATHVEGVEGVQIEVRQWKPGSGWDPRPWDLYGQLTPTTARYLATAAYWKDMAWIDTFLNPGYQAVLPEMPRRLEDTGSVQRPDHEVFDGVEKAAGTNAIACGSCAVRIGDRSFDCLRIIQLEGTTTASTAPLTVGYVREDGRALLVRHYCHPGAAEPVDEQARLFVDGQLFIHWFDCLSSLALEGEA